MEIHVLVDWIGCSCPGDRWNRGHDRVKMSSTTQTIRYRTSVLVLLLYGLYLPSEVQRMEHEKASLLAHTHTDAVPLFVGNNRFSLPARFTLTWRGLSM